ncbi:hypothetical protein CMI37_37230 [Candidatus Pacearchaeota archaeon]|nr:hypothetical protein [Candidatus Pacearchaeota archaeon]|tara:strand:+ start:2221 stop:2403 length:183 start_codon:yes stop_codon:yes gene_type:complete
MYVPVYKYLNSLLYFCIYMPTIIISKDVHQRWKVYCAEKGIKITDATDIALELAMKGKKA